MFLITYVSRELRRRMRQAVLIALGLALGVGLVVTVAATSAGYKNAQSAVLSGLYGVGTDVTVTGPAPIPPKPGTPPSQGGAQSIKEGPHGPETCSSNGKCTSLAGTRQDNMNSPYQGISSSKVAEAASLARPAERRNDHLRPLVHRRRRGRRRRTAGLRVRQSQQPEGRLDRHHPPG